MAWDFETDPEFQIELDWIDQFVREEVEPLDHVIDNPYDLANDKRNALIKPLQARVRDRKLWACHLGPDLGGPGYGQVKLALMNEIHGRSVSAPIVFGCQAPDSGNGEILAMYGSDDQKERFLKPLLENEIVSCFSMTEPQGGSDPKVFKTKAELIGNEWVINGEKWFSSNAKFAEFFIVMAVSELDASPYRRMSMFVVPADTPGINIIRNVSMREGSEGTHGYVRYEDVRIPADHILGGRGLAFEIAQNRLGGGRIHHAMRTMAQIRMAFDMMCERVLSRETQGERLADKQMVQEKIADSWVEMEQFRLLLLRTAWLIDKHKDYQKVRKDIAAIKIAMPKVLHDVASRALLLHGALGVSTEMPFARQVIDSYYLGMGDGPTEVHKITLAKQVLRGYQATDDLFPTRHLLKERDHAQQKYGQFATLTDDEV